MHLKVIVDVIQLSHMLESDILKEVTLTYIPLHVSTFQLLYFYDIIEYYLMFLEYFTIS